MSAKKGFTLIEVLLAMTFGSIVILGITTAISQLRRSIDQVAEMTNNSRRVEFFFNQLERDLSTAIKPPLFDEKPSGAEEKEGEKKQTNEKKEKKKKPIIFFLCKTAEDGDTTIKKKKFSLLRKLSMVNTSPLSTSPMGTFARKRDHSESLVQNKDHNPRIIRCSYDLIEPKKKKAKRGEPISYTLFRRETQNLRNEKLITPKDTAELSKPEVAAFNKIDTVKILDDIRALYIELVFPPEDDEKKEEKSTASKDEKKEYKRTFTWPEEKKAPDSQAPDSQAPDSQALDSKDATPKPDDKKKKEQKQRHLPLYAEVTLSLWRNDKKYHDEYFLTIPVLVEEHEFEGGEQRNVAPGKKDKNPKDETKNDGGPGA
ncbi:hypothetical protein HOD08_00695 [bacterium]|nr:hypothetical protein [bacterium]